MTPGSWIRLSPSVRGLPWVYLCLGLILLLGLGLRLNGVNWDDGYGFHPDERDIYMRSGCMYEALVDAPGYQDCGYLRDFPETTAGVPSPAEFFDAGRSPLNPHWFPLGSILIYVLVFFRSVVELFTDVSALDMRYVGRPLSALADVGSVFFVFLLGRRMHGPVVGLLAALFVSLAVINVQNSHFYRPETLSVLLTLGAFWAMLRVMETGRLRDSALLGLLVGMALAPKVSVLPLLAPLALVYGSRLWDAGGGRFSAIPAGAFWSTIGHACLAGVIALAAFFVTTPYSLLDYRAFAEGVGSQVAMASTAGSLPFTIQYVGTPPFLYQVQQTSVWGLGLPLGILAWLAIPFTVAMAMYGGRRRADLLVLAWVVPTFLFLESFEVRFLRYMTPLVPFMLLMASRMGVWAITGSADLGRKWKAAQSEGENPPPHPLVWKLGGMSPTLVWISGGLVALVVASTAFYSFAFQRVYADEHPAIAASTWFNETVPSGAPIVSDNHWDEHIPNMYQYRMWQYPVYETDTTGKMRTLAARLAMSDYLVFYSNRPYSSVARDPGRFPLSHAYYQQLFSGELGYQLHRRFSSYPRLWGVEFRHNPLPQAGLSLPESAVPDRPAVLALDLGYADDVVAGYDHPQVLVFKNEERLPQSLLEFRLTRQPAPESGLLMTPEQKAVQRAGGTWSEIVNRDGWPNKLPVLAWLGLVEIVYLVALPLAMFLFRPLPDRGIVLARILGLLAVSYFSWVLVSLGWAEFSRSVFYIGLLILALLSIAVSVFRWREIWSFLVQHWRSLLFAEALFLACFLAFVALRSANPDLWHAWRGGEKPMEMTYLNAVIRSTLMPPYDPWYAGGYLNYYYWGYFVIAGLVRVTGILPSVAFNLAVPLFFSLTFTGAYSLVYNLTEGVRRARTSGEHAGDGLDRISWLRSLSRRTSVWAGLTAGLFTSVIGNLDGIVQVAQGTWFKLVDGQSFPAFDFWRSSRMIPNLDDFEPSVLAFWVPDSIPGHTEISTHITEFPFFTFLFADLHAHMMVMPFTLLLLGFALSLVAGLRGGGIGWVASLALGMGVTLGSLWVINSWDYPSYVLLTLALTGLAVYCRPGPVAGRLVLWAVLAVASVAVSIVSFLPFHQSYETFQSGIEASKWKTPLLSFMGVHGLFLFLIASFLLVQSRRTLWYGAISLARWPLCGVGLTPGEDVHRSGGTGFAAVIVAVGLVLAVFFAAAGYWTVALLVTLMGLTMLALLEAMDQRAEELPWIATAMVLAGMGLAIAAGVDIVRIEGDIGRMNTQFKYYLEVWVLFSAASAFFLWQLVERCGERLAWRQAVWIGVLLLLVGSSLIYTIWGTKSRLADRFDHGPITLDGADYMTRAVHWEEEQPITLRWDLQAIDWLQDNVKGSPVVLEAHGDQYRWNGRIAKYTGLPTVLGWPWHQVQQRMAYERTVRQRALDVRELYDTGDLVRAKELLDQYEVTYIVVGELERIYYSDAGLRKFQDLSKSGYMRPVYENEQVVIYERDSR